MRVFFTDHAQTAIEARGIPAAWVERVAEAPERVEPDRVDPELEHRLGRIPEYGGRVLRVVLCPFSHPLRVVTAYFDRTMRRRL